VTLGDVAFSVVALAFAWLVRQSLRGVRRVPDLEPFGAPQPGLVSVLVPARDAEDRLRETLARVLAQRGVDVELVVVDDRSTDRTPAIVAEFAARDARVRALRIDALPEGWLGKCHALHVAAEAARGDWLLCTDSDTWLGEDVIARAVATARGAGADHVTLVPHLARTSPLGRAVVLTMCLGLFGQAEPTNRDRSYLGLGAFNLVRVDAYRAIGGHEALRLSIVDDIELGRMLRQRGFRTRVRLALADLEVEWVTTLRSAFRLTEKNYFAVFRFRVPPVALTLALSGGAWLGAAAGPIVGTLPGLCAGMALWSLAIPGWLTARRYGWSPWLALGVPLLLPVVLAIIANSALRTLARGGVRWRGTFYPLARLRDAERARRARTS
jgi:hypothetical protein